MSLRLIVCCDSDPAAYAPDAGERCRAWLTTRHDNPVGAHVEAGRAGWGIALTVSRAGINSYRHTCPACQRAAQRPQEATP